LLNLTSVVTDIIEREGGYVNHPMDRGGPSNMGITLRTLSNWRGTVIFPIDVEKLKRSEAERIYVDLYWTLPGFGCMDLPDEVAVMVLDTAVHSGPRLAKKLLQRALNVKADGLIGPVSLDAIEEASEKPIKLAVDFMGERILFLGRIITMHPHQAVFAHGWMSRIKQLLQSLNFD
jgi:lysozyme family protein